MGQRIGGIFIIKSLRELGKEDIDKVVRYLNEAEEDNKSVDERLKELNSKIYNFGEGVLFYFYENQVLGSAKVVLEAVKHLSVIYIYYLTVDKKNKYRESIIKELIKKGINIGVEKECKSIILGINDDEIIEIGKSLGYIPSYSAYKMILKDRDLIYKPLELVKLSEDNKEKYLEVFNDSFSDMPHGCYYELSDIENYLEDKSENKYYLVREEGKIIGFMNIEIDDNVGSFDIGLCKEYRNRGYGKLLLESAINSLNESNAKKVTLTVIEKNHVALNMYIKRGFEIESNLCRWTVIK